MTTQQTSIAQYYHECTKYSPETLATRSQGLDWENQPIPFKDYKIGQSINLRTYLEEPVSPEDLEGDRHWWQRLSRLLFCSYGLTAKIPTMMGDPIYLRAAPSAGGLYPAEIYLISRGTPQLPVGLYNYQSKTHSLVRFWDSDVWQKLQEACFWHPALDGTPIALLTTGVFFRSAWRYQARAYRRIFLDTGHLLGNIELASAINNFRPHLIGGFIDEAINALLYLDPAQEATLTIIPLADRLTVRENLPRTETALPSVIQTDYPELQEEDLLTHLHRATEIPLNTAPKTTWKPTSEAVARDDKYNFPFCTKVGTTAREINWGEALEGLGKTMLRRRSTRAYSGLSITLEQLNQILDFTYQPQHYLGQGLDPQPDYFDLDLIETFITVSGVEGLEGGCYYYAPRSQELRQIRFKNFRQELHYLCLGQDLGRDAAALVFHTADLKRAIHHYGDRAYRYLHLDAGHLGQRLNLAALHIGLGVSGIGGFFDDQVNEVLGIPPDEAVLYITTIGQPRT